MNLFASLFCTRIKKHFKTTYSASQKTKIHAGILFKNNFSLNYFI